VRYYPGCLFTGERDACDRPSRLIRFVLSKELVRARLFDE
jgi:hypothetical protein